MIEEETMDAGAQTGLCWFCHRDVPADSLIAGYDTWDEQRLACNTCNDAIRWLNDHGHVVSRAAAAREPVAPAEADPAGLREAAEAVATDVESWLGTPVPSHVVIERVAKPLRAVLAQPPAPASAETTVSESDGSHKHDFKCTGCDARHRLTCEQYVANRAALAQPPAPASADGRQEYVSPAPRWWRDGAMVNGSEGSDLEDTGFVADAASDDDAQRLVDEHNALARDFDLAVAHDRQPYPTAWAYEQACKARDRWQAAAEAVIALVPVATGTPPTQWQRNNKAAAESAIDALRVAIRGTTETLDVRDPRFLAAVDEVFAAPGEFGPAKGYYGADTGHFIDMLAAALRGQPSEPAS